MACRGMRLHRLVRHRIQSFCTWSSVSSVTFVCARARYQYADCLGGKMNFAQEVREADNKRK